MPKCFWHPGVLLFVPVVRVKRQLSYYVVRFAKSTSPWSVDSQNGGVQIQVISNLYNLLDIT